MCLASARLPVGKDRGIVAVEDCLNRGPDCLLVNLRLGSSCVEAFVEAIRSNSIWYLAISCKHYRLVLQRYEYLIVGRYGHAVLRDSILDLSLEWRPHPYANCDVVDDISVFWFA